MARDRRCNVNRFDLGIDLAREPFRRWLAYSEQLRTDPSLLAYYDFQLKPSRPSVLPNVAAGGDQSLDGVVENATWTTGRMPGKHALLFSNSADYVRVNSIADAATFEVQFTASERVEGNRAGRRLGAVANGF